MLATWPGEGVLFHPVIVILAETDLLFDLRLMVKVVGEGIMHLRRSEVRIALQDVIHRPLLFVIPGNETDRDTRTPDDGPASAGVSLVFNIRMHDFANS